MSDLLNKTKEKRNKFLINLVEVELKEELESILEDIKRHGQGTTNISEIRDYLKLKGFSTTSGVSYVNGTQYIIWVEND